MDQPALAGTGERLFDLAALTRQVAAAFDCRPEIVAADPLIAATLDLAADDEPAAWIWPPTTRLLAGEHPPEGLNRIGRHGLGGTGAIPASTEALLAAYPADGTHAVVLAEAAVALAAGQPCLPAGWPIRRPGAG